MCVRVCVLMFIGKYWIKKLFICNSVPGFRMFLPFRHERANVSACRRVVAHVLHLAAIYLAPAPHALLRSLESLR